MSFSKMYLVTEEEYARLKKRKPKLPQDVQVVTNSLKAVCQKRKKESFSPIISRMKNRKVRNGVEFMKDADVAAPLRRAASPMHPRKYAVTSPTVTPRRSIGARLELLRQ